MTENDGIKILFVEDIPTDTVLAEREFKTGGIKYSSMRVDTREDFLEALHSFAPDIVISDYSMPVFDGMTALHLAREFDPYIPFIVLTGSMNEETAVTCMKAGASDYVIKEHMSRLTLAALEAIERKKHKVESLKQEELLRQSEERYRSIFEGSSAVMLIVDMAETAIIDANRAAVKFYGWQENELIGKRMNQINTVNPVIYKEQLRMAMLREKNRFEFKHHLSDGSAVDVEVYANPISIGGKTYLFSIVHDISERIAAERDLGALTKKLAHYLSTSPTVTYSMALQDGKARFNWISENATGILGYPIKDILMPDWWFDNLFAADRNHALKGISELVKKERYSQEYRFIKQDRTMVWLRDDMRLCMGIDGASEIIGTLTDISGKKSIEKEVSLKSSALDAADNAVVITDRTGTIEWVNQAFCALSGYSMDEAKGKNPRDLVKSGKQEPETYRSLWNTITAGKVWRGEIVNRKKSGELCTEELTITPVMDTSGKIEHFIAIISDITQRVLAHAMLESSLREKEVLLREVHHRVKNNIQIIMSLLSLSAESIPDAPVRMKLAEVTRRIKAMALVHQQIYESENIEHIDFSLYMHSLVSDLLQEYEADFGIPEVKYETEQVFLGLEQAIPAGILVSELVSNSLKFAFTAKPAVKNLEVSICRAGGEDVKLTIRDNGIGFPSSFNREMCDSLGIRLIEILCQQLDGTVDFQTDGGAVTTVRFKAHPEFSKG